MLRPYRRDGYEHRVRVHVRMGPETYETLQVLAESLHMSVNLGDDVVRRDGPEDVKERDLGCREDAGSEAVRGTAEAASQKLVEDEEDDGNEGR